MFENCLHFSIFGAQIWHFRKLLSFFDTEPTLFYVMLRDFTLILCHFMYLYVFLTQFCVVLRDFTLIGSQIGAHNNSPKYKQWYVWFHLGCQVKVPAAPGLGQITLVICHKSCHVTDWPGDILDNMVLWHRPINYWITVIWETKSDMSVWDPSNELRAELSSILPLKLFQMVEYEMEYEHFRCVSLP
jgi:hypothetical protein